MVSKLNASNVDKAERVKCRTVGGDDDTTHNTPAENAVASALSAVAASLEKQKSATNSSDHHSPAAVHQVEGTVPSSITCESDARSGSREGGKSRSNRRVDTSFSNAASARSTGGNERSPTSQNSVGSLPLGNDQTRMDVCVPVWLQQSRSSQKDLFCEFICSLVWICGHNIFAYLWS